MRLALGLVLASTVSTGAFASTWSCAAYCANPATTNRYDSVVVAEGETMAEAFKKLDDQCNGGKRLVGGHVAVAEATNDHGIDMNIIRDALISPREACQKN